MEIGIFYFEGHSNTYNIIEVKRTLPKQKSSVMQKTKKGDFHQ